MKPAAEIALLAGGAVVVVAIVAIKGKGTTVGATFSAANPTSVAAVTSAGASEIASINDLTLQKMKTAASTIVAIAQLQNVLDTTRLGVSAQEYSANQGTLQVGLQTDSQNFATATLSNAQTEQARINAAAATQQAGIGAMAAQRAAEIAAAAQDYAAQINGQVQQTALGVQKDISNNAVTAARVNKPSWFASLTNAASNVAAAYLGAQSGKPPGSQGLADASAYGQYPNGQAGG